MRSYVLVAAAALVVAVGCARARPPNLLSWVAPHVHVQSVVRIGEGRCSTKRIARVTKTIDHLAARPNNPPWNQVCECLGVPYGSVLAKLTHGTVDVVTLRPTALLPDQIRFRGPRSEKATRKMVMGLRLHGSATQTALFISHDSFKHRFAPLYTEWLLPGDPFDMRHSKCLG